MENNKQLLNIDEVAQYLNVKKATIYDWVYHKRIPYIKLGKCLRFKKELIDMWIEKFQNIPLQLQPKILYNKKMVGGEEAI